MRCRIKIEQSVFETQQSFAWEGRLRQMKIPTSATVRGAIGICLAMVLLVHEDAHAKCPPPTEIHLIEVVINSCELSSDIRGALVTGQIYAEIVIPRWGYQPDPDTTDWRIERHSPPTSKQYFFVSQSGSPCTELTNRSPLLMRESRACCDTPTFPKHPACTRKILKYAPDWIVAYGATRPPAASE